MYQYLNNKELVIFGDGLQKRAFSYIDDCLAPLWKAGTEKNASKQIINLGGTHAISIVDACNTLIRVMGGGKVDHLDGRHEVKEAWCTTQKSVDILNYSETTSLEDGLKSMWDWAKKQSTREQKMFSKYEINKNIYSYWNIDSC